MVTAKKKTPPTTLKVTAPAKPARAPRVKPTESAPGVARVAAKPPAVAQTAKAPGAPPAKAEKPKKPKLVRDSFTIPKAEYAVLDDLKRRSALLIQPAKKSELLRAGIKALAAMSDTAFAAALAAVPTIKTGRPKA